MKQANYNKHSIEALSKYVKIRLTYMQKTSSDFFANMGGP